MGNGLTKFFAAIGIACVTFLVIAALITAQVALGIDTQSLWSVVSNIILVMLEALTFFAGLISIVLVIFKKTPG